MFYFYTPGTCSVSFKSETIRERKGNENIVVSSLYLYHRYENSFIPPTNDMKKFLFRGIRLNIYVRDYYLIERDEMWYDVTFHIQNRLRIF